MTLIDTYDDLLRNCAELEDARKDGGQVHGLYAGLMGRGSVILPYLTGDGIAFPLGRRCRVPSI